MKPKIVVPKTVVVELWASAAEKAGSKKAGRIRSVARRARGRGNIPPNAARLRPRAMVPPAGMVAPEAAAAAGISRSSEKSSRRSRVQAGSAREADILASA
jgi:hypothetical protein